MTLSELQDVLKQIQFEEYQFFLRRREDHYLLFARYDEKDIVTGQVETQTTRKWFISEHVSKSEFVQSVFKLCLTSMEHRTREEFRYNKKRIFGPHFDVDALHQICVDKKFDYREPHLQDGRT